MKQVVTIKHEFVESFPDKLKERTLYVSMEFASTSHLCACGCGKEVVAPLSPTDWKLMFDGKTITLNPSIGNWSFPCQSHYWIRNNRVEWAQNWTAAEIKEGRAYDKYAKDKYFDAMTEKPKAMPHKATPKPVEIKPITPDPGLWEKVTKWWRGE